jgi:serine protease
MAVWGVARGWALGALALCASLAPAAAQGLGATVAPSSVAAPSTVAGAAQSDRLIVRYRDNGRRQAQAAGRSSRAQAALAVAANRQGVQLRLQHEGAQGVQVFQLNRALPLAALQNLAASLREGDPDVEFAEPDVLMHTQALPNDQLLNQQWAMLDDTVGIRAPLAWERSTGRGVVVAVVDTGVRQHLDLRANLLPGHDFISSTHHSADGDGRDADASDPGDAAAAGTCSSGSEARQSSWHGTHVAGIVAAVGGNATGVVGVAYGARVLPVRALGRCGGYTSDIADAIVWAAGGDVAGVPANPTPARVINLSMAALSTCAQTTQRAIDFARSRGAVVVAAAGNHGGETSASAPANCRGVIAVAATGPQGGKASYSNHGAAVSLAAPGGDLGQGILSTLNSGVAGPGADSYAAYQGTSMAAPAVAGVAALMLSANPRLTPDQVAQLLRSTARPFSAACTGCGAGLVAAPAAVAAAANAPLQAVNAEKVVTRAPLHNACPSAATSLLNCLRRQAQR